MTDIAQFVDAVKRGDLGKVELLLARERDLVRATDDHGVSVILLALYHRHPAVAQALVSRRTRLSMPEACALGRVDEARSILAANQENARMPAPDGHTPLGLASFFGHVEMVALLLDNGADPTIPSANSMHVTPLHSAVAVAEPDHALAIVTQLLAHGADPDAKQQGGWTALHAAAQRGLRDVVTALLEAGASAAPVSDDGITPAMLARKGGLESLAASLENRRGSMINEQ